MVTVDILLASYNGAKYIKSQILSIISQQFEDWRLLVHDDGSTDNTIEIIRQLISIESRIEIIDDGVKCGGAAQNFMHLTKYATADFVMFADQDDIWLDNKISLMYDVFVNLDHSKPQVIYSNSYAWKPEKGIEGLSTYTFAENLKQFLFLNSGIQGCVAMFNTKMNAVLKSWDKPFVMHDQVLHLAGVMIGEVSYVHIPLMMYRKSGENLTGDTIVNKNDLNRIKKNRQIPVVHQEHFDVVVDFYQKYKTQISSENTKLIEAYKSMVDKSLCGRISSVLRNGFMLMDSNARLIIKIILRPYINYVQRW